VTNNPIMDSKRPITTVDSVTLITSLSFLIREGKYEFILRLVLGDKEATAENLLVFRSPKYLLELCQ